MYGLQYKAYFFKLNKLCNAYNCFYSIKRCIMYSRETYNYIIVVIKEEIILHHHK